MKNFSLVSLVAFTFAMVSAATAQNLPAGAFAPQPMQQFMGAPQQNPQYVNTPQTLSVPQVVQQPRIQTTGESEGSSNCSTNRADRTRIVGGSVDFQGQTGHN